MHNTALNNLKSYSVTSNKRKIILSLFNSQQMALRNSTLDFIIKPYKASSDLKIEIISLRPIEPILATIDSSSKSIIINEIIPESSKSNYDNLSTKISESKAQIILIVGFEILSFLNQFSSADIFASSLKNNTSTQKSKFVHFVCFTDQFRDFYYQKSIRNAASFIIDFSSAKTFDKFNVDCFQFSDVGFNVYEKIGGNCSNNNLILSKLIDQKAPVKMTNPDKMMSTTFKLGISDSEREQKDKVVLPYLKNQEIIKEQETGNEEDLEFELDDEQDPDDDFDV